MEVKVVQYNASLPVVEMQREGMDTNPAIASFKVLYALVQLCGLTLIGLMLNWLVQHLNGFAGTSHPAQEFNWHPLLMTIGMIYLYGNAILIYRGFAGLRKRTLKLAHTLIHSTVFILTVIALQAAFDSHNLSQPPKPNMYSLHSWLGLSTVILFSLQYVLGFVAFLYPGARQSYRIALMPYHLFFGLLIFAMAIASALTGITEKAIFSIKDYSNLPTAGVIANLSSVLVVIFGALVFYLATNSLYKRKPLPEDTNLLTN